MNALAKMTRFSRVILYISVILLAAQIISMIFVDTDTAVGHIAFQIFENLLMIIVILLPPLLGKTTGKTIPMAMEIAFVGFCFASLVMGDLFDFYGRFKWWDMALHVISGIMLGIIGHAMIVNINGVDINKTQLPLAFEVLWILCFALAAGAMWEIWEYVTDGIFGLNSQEFLLTSGTFDDSTPLMGRAALKDTMEDLILDFFGAFAVAAYVILAKVIKNIKNKYVLDT